MSEFSAVVQDCARETGLSEEACFRVLTWAGVVNDRSEGAIRKVANFLTGIIGLPVPVKPTMLPANRQEYAARHLTEELCEFKYALENSDLPSAVDALVDLIYVAAGRLVEMGVFPMLAFDEVHRANMSKARGTVSKRAKSSGGFDAVKPEGWTPPDIQAVLSFGLEDFKAFKAISPVHLEIAKLRAKKGNDYNSSIQLTDYFPFGHQSYVQMIYLKALRLVSLTELISSGKTPNFEGLEDTVLDLLNYATFYAEWLKRQTSAEEG